MKRTEWNWWGHVAGVGSSEVEMLKEEITKRKKHKEIGVVAAEAIFDEFFLLERENDEGCEVGLYTSRMLSPPFHQNMEI